MKEFFLLIASPTELFRYDNVSYLSLNTTEGVVGFMANHANIIYSLREGDVIINKTSNECIMEKNDDLLKEKLALMNIDFDFEGMPYDNCDDNENRVVIKASSGLVRFYDNLCVILLENSLT